MPEPKPNPEAAEAHRLALIQPVLDRAEEEAKFLGHNYIGPEHFLLGLVSLAELDRNRESHQIFEDFELESRKIRSGVEFIVGRGDRPSTGNLRDKYTPTAKSVLSNALDSMRRGKREQVTEGDLVIGMLIEGTNRAGGILESMGVGVEELYQLANEETRPMAKVNLQLQKLTKELQDSERDYGLEFTKDELTQAAQTLRGIKNLLLRTRESRKGFR